MPFQFSSADNELAFVGVAEVFVSASLKRLLQIRLESMAYHSEITEMVRSFLATLSPGLTLESEMDSRAAVLKASGEFGFGEPFDREQKTINAMLIETRANVIVCRVAWGFYYDSKLIDARKV